MGALRTKAHPTKRVLMVSPNSTPATADVPENQLPGRVLGYLSGYVHVPSLFEEQTIVDAAATWLRGREHERVECLWEPFVLLAARLRERFGIPGTSCDVIRAFRDKDPKK
ncbi:MAG: hypothetical protein SF028_03210 [Candidatus Sumerlaeia bacterium]|nr:hypothetical protein [Candidatus Sumerlaeia bacterium]